MENYSKEQIAEFRQHYEAIRELDRTFRDLRIGDVFVDENKMLVPKGLGVIRRYKKKVPAEFKENFNFNVKKLEEKILNLQKMS